MPINESADAPQDVEFSLPGEVRVLQRVRAVLKHTFANELPYLVVGYSGGRDSLALLLLLRELDRLGACRMTAVHIDHRIQSDSAEVAQQVVAIAKNLGVRSMLMEAHDHPSKIYPGVGLEDAARRIRYRCFHRAVSELGADAVAVGHHQRDQAETVLLHLLRGSGLSGLRGMAVDSRVPVYDAEHTGGSVRVIRPLLHEHPTTLEDIVQQSGLPLIVDPSNEDLAYRRNRIRHELLPLLEDIAPGASSRLVSLADLVGDDDAALDEIADVFLRCASDRGVIVWERLQMLPLGLQRRIVRRWLSNATSVSELSRDRIDAVLTVGNRGEGGKRIEVGEGWYVTYLHGRLGVSQASGNVEKSHVE